MRAVEDYNPSTLKDYEEPARTITCMGYIQWTGKSSDHRLRFNGDSPPRSCRKQKYLPREGGCQNDRSYKFSAHKPIRQSPKFHFFTYRVTRKIKQKIGIRQVKSTGGLDSRFRSNDVECTSHVIPT